MSRARLALAGLAGLVLAGTLLLRLTAPDEEPFALPAPPPASGHTHAESAVTTPPPPAMLRDPFCAPISPAGAAAPCPVVPSPAAPQRIRLVHVFVDGGHPHARFEIGTTSVVVHVEEPFGGTYRVVRLADGCADVLDGDAPFRVCVGEEVVR